MKIRPSLTALLLFLTTSLYCQGIVFSSGDFDFEVYGNDSTEVQLKALDGTLKGDIVIPDSVSYKGRTYAVTRIYNMGDNPNVLSIRIPKTVRSFYNSLNSLSSLQNIYVDESNPSFISIDGVLISTYNMSLSQFPRGRTGEYTVPEGVQSINTTFHSGITKLTIPSTVQYVSSSIGNYVTEFKVAGNNTTFSSINGALCSKDGKTLIAYPATQESLVFIPASIDSIGTYAFQRGRKLLLNSTTPPIISSYNITSIYVKSDDLANYQSNSRTSKYNLFGYDLIKDSILYAKTSDGNAAVVGSYSQSENLVIPQTITDESGTNNVTKIDRRAFYQSNTFKNIILPKTLTSIGDSAFYNTTSIQEITLPASLIEIGKNAFLYCYVNVYAECAPVDISAGCFNNYRNLYVPSEYENEYRAASGWKYFTIFANDLAENGFVYKKLTDETVSIVKYTGNAKDIVIPDVVNIGGETFKVTEIENRCFSSKDIISLKLPQYLKSIGDYAFAWNYSLKEIILPANLEIIGEDAFYNCGLTTIDIPQSIVSIGNYAFYGNSISSIYLQNHELFNIGQNAFGYTSNVKILISPLSFVAAFKMAENWKNYKIIGVDALCDGLGYKILSDTEAAVVCGSNSFNSSSNIRRIDIPTTVIINDRNYQVVTIADSAFFQSNANYYTIPETVDSIGYRAFYSYNNITVIVEKEIPARINDETFYQWYSKVILVPPTVVETYKETVGWQKVSNYIKANGTMIDGIIYKPLDDNRAVVDLAVAIPTSGVLFLPKEVNIDDKNYQVAVIGQDAFNNNRPQYLILPETIDSIYNPNSLSNYITYLPVAVPPKTEGYHTNRRFFVPSTAKSNYDANPKWHYTYNDEDYIVGVDGIVDSLIYKTTTSNNVALMAWMKTVISNDTITVPSEITIVNGQKMSVSDLADELFYRFNPRKLVLPATINNVGKNALPPNVNTVTLDAIVPPSIGTQDNISSSATLWVKGQSVQAYLDTEIWNKFKIRSEDEDSPQFSLRALDDENVEITGVLADGLKTLTIPDSLMLYGKKMRVKSVGDKAFSTLSSLQSLSVSASVENFGYKVFYNGSNLSKIQVRAGNQQFISKNDKMLLTKDGKTLVRVASSGIQLEREYDYETHSYLKKNTLDGVENLAPGALDGYYPSSCYSYHNNDYLQNCLPLPTSLKSISGEDLMYVQNLRNITVDTLHQTLCDVDGVLFSNDTTSIIRYPHYRYNYGIREYELPSKVRRIEKLAFYNAQFESLTLSDSLKYIADSAFCQPSGYSRTFQSLILYNEEIAQASNLSFTDNMYKNTILYVPMGTQYDYLTTSPWSKFRNINSSKLAEEDFLLLKAFYEEMGNGEGWYRQWTFGETADETRITRGIRMIDDHVYSIDLSGNGLKGSLSDKIFKLPRLEILNLSSNELSCPIDSVLNPENIDNSVLRELNISSNQLTGNIGSVTNTLKNLTTLNVSNNKLTQVTPMLSSRISNLSIYNQKMDTIDYKSLYLATTEDVEAGIPNLLFYDHYNQNFTSDGSFTLQSTDDDYWLMTLKIKNGELSASEYSSYYRLYKRPNGDILRLSDNNNGHTIPVRMLFDQGDVNLDTLVNVSDLQLTVNYAVSEETEHLFNFTAADIQTDDWVNVQDVVCLVNLLLDQHIDANSESGARMRAARVEDADARLFWRGNQLVLETNRDIAALDIAIENANDVKWLMNDVDYDVSISKQKGYVRVIHYSMAGKDIKAGEHVIAESIGHNMNILKADLVGKDGHLVKTNISGAATGIEEVSSDNTNIRISANITGVNILTGQPMTNLEWVVYGLNGNMLGKDISDLSSGLNSLNCNLAGESQVVVRLSNDKINITKKVSIIK